MHDVGVEEGRVFLAMEFVQGRDLAAWAKTRRSVAETLRVYLQAGEGLAAAHRAGHATRGAERAAFKDLGCATMLRASTMTVEVPHMPKPSWSALALTLVVAGACSRTIEDKVVDARKAPCTTLCNRMAECPGELPTQNFDTRDECFRLCTEIGGTFDESWGRTKDMEKDMCFDEFVAQIDCFESLTCEERRTDFTLGTSESQCGWSVSAAGKCARQYKDGGQ